MLLENECLKSRIHREPSEREARTTCDRPVEKKIVALTKTLLPTLLVNICTHYTRSIKIAKSRYKVFIERMWKISGGIRGEGYVEDVFLKVRVENIKV